MVASKVREGYRAAEVKSQLETIGLKGEPSLKLLHTALMIQKHASKNLQILELIFRSSGSSSW